QVVDQRRGKGGRRVGNHVEYFVALEPVVEDTGARTEHESLLSGDVPCESEAGRIVNPAILDEVLADILARLLNALEQVTGAVHDRTDVGAVEDRSGSGIDRLPVGGRAGRTIDARSLRRVELLRKEG